MREKGKIMEQIVLQNYEELNDLLKSKRTLIVCSLNEKERWEKLVKLKDISLIYFHEFHPNPEYASAEEGFKCFMNHSCDCILAVGGGSAIDVAKCIRIKVEKNIPFIAIPTTAGTGSEATSFAVVYQDCQKLSITDQKCLPNYVLLDGALLNTLPKKQRIATVFDTISHCIESIWCQNSTEESLEFAEKGLKLALSYQHSYFEGSNENNQELLRASNFAGKAINITKTTAGHAMCYQLTTLYGIPHGLATMLINSELYPYMIENCKNEEVLQRLKRISDLLGCQDLEDGKNYFRKVLKELHLYDVPIPSNDINQLVSSVNQERLKNNPMVLDSKDIEKIYKNLMRRRVEDCES